MNLKRAGDDDEHSDIHVKKPRSTSAYAPLSPPKDPLCLYTGWRVVALRGAKHIKAHRLGVFILRNATQECLLKVPLDGLSAQEWERIQHVDAIQAKIDSRFFHVHSFSDLCPRVQYAIRMMLASYNMLPADSSVTITQCVYPMPLPTVWPACDDKFLYETFFEFVCLKRDGRQFVFRARHTGTGESFVFKFNLSDTEDTWNHEVHVALSAQRALGEFAQVCRFGDMSVSLKDGLRILLDRNRRRGLPDKYAMILITRYVEPFQGKTLMDLVRSNEIKEKDFKAVILQIFAKLYTIRQTYPGFQHGDLHSRNYIVWQSDTPVGPLAVPGVGVFNIDSTLHVTLIDFGVAALYPSVHWKSNFSDSEWNLSGLTPHHNPKYDHHLLLNSIYSALSSRRDWWFRFREFVRSIIRDKTLLGEGTGIDFSEPVYSNIVGYRLSRVVVLVYEYTRRVRNMEPTEQDFLDIRDLIKLGEGPLFSVIPTIPETIEHTTRSRAALDTTYIPTDKQVVPLDEVFRSPYFHDFLVEQ